MVMIQGRIRLAVAVAAGLLGSAALGALPGCTQPGPIASRRNTVGALKASVSQLEYANDNLKKQVADLKAEKTRVANDLDDEAVRNGELSARLDDAKTALRRQGGGSSVASLDPGGSPSSSAKASRAAATAGDDDIPSPRRSSSSVRPSKSARKPPTTQIPRIESAADADPGALELPPAEKFDPGPQASRAADDRWLPVARGPHRGGSVEVR